MGAAVDIVINSETDAQISQRLISCVENDVRLNKNLNDEEFVRYRKVFLEVSQSPHLNKERALKWMLWGTREGFTII